MADKKLAETVNISAVSLIASSLPPGLSPAFSDYLLRLANEFPNVTDKANEASGGAYDAQVSNDAQDVTLGEHEQELADHEQRITANEEAITALDQRLDTAEQEIDFLQQDYVSKTAVTLQSLASPLGITTSLSVNGVKVVGTRDTGWTAATGTPLKGAFNSSNGYTTGTTYSQFELQQIAIGLVQARQRVKALEDALRAHGLID